MAISVTEQEIAKFQEAFFTRPGDGSLTADKVKKMVTSLGLTVPDKDIQVGTAKNRGPPPCFALLSNQPPHPLRHCVPRYSFE
jgi:hypothetical protein